MSKIQKETNHEQMEELSNEDKWQKLLANLPPESKIELVDMTLNTPRTRS